MIKLTENQIESSYKYQKCTNHLQAFGLICDKPMKY